MGEEGSDAREESIQKRHVALYSMAVACTALGLVEWDPGLGTLTECTQELVHGGRTAG